MSDAGAEVAQVEAIDAFTGEVLVDERPPVITLRGPPVVTVQLPSRRPVYMEPGTSQSPSLAFICSASHGLFVFSPVPHE